MAPVLAICADADVAGAPLFAMNYVDGEVIDTPFRAEGYSNRSRRALAFDLVNVLAQLQKVDLTN